MQPLKESSKQNNVQQPKSLDHLKVSIKSLLKVASQLNQIYSNSQVSQQTLQKYLPSYQTKQRILFGKQNIQPTIQSSKKRRVVTLLQISKPNFEQDNPPFGQPFQNQNRPHDESLLLEKYLKGTERDRADRFRQTWRNIKEEISAQRETSRSVGRLKAVMIQQSNSKSQPEKPKKVKQRANSIKNIKHKTIEPEIATSDPVKPDPIRYSPIKESYIGIIKTIKCRIEFSKQSFSEKIHSNRRHEQQQLLSRNTKQIKCRECIIAKILCSAKNVLIQ